MNCSRKMIQEGLVDGLPLLMGFIPVAMTFGILCRSTGLSFLFCTLMSVAVFAGASQFMALNLVLAGSGVPEAIFATFLVNIRHLLMSFSLSERIQEELRPWRPLVGFGITDEVFSIASFRKKQLGQGYLISLQIVAYGSWVLGSVAGFLVGGFLPNVLKVGMGIALYALFIALLLPEVKRSSQAGLVALLAGAFHLIIQGSGLLPGGWSLSLAIFLAALLSAGLVKEVCDE